jgi:hypothetical protein
MLTPVSSALSRLTRPPLNSTVCSSSHSQLGKTGTMDWTAPRRWIGWRFVRPCGAAVIRASLFREEINMAEPSYEELKARVAELEKTQGRKRGSLEFKVSEKGGMSVYGLGRFPVTLYYEQWTRLLDQTDQIREFLEANKAGMKLKNTE